jgi:hypothetical protein
MGSANSRLKIHRYCLRNLVDISILAIDRNVFLWLCVYLDPTLRNGKVSVHLIRYILWGLRGYHHIHVLRSLKSLHTLARVDKWRVNGIPRYFEDCRAYGVISRDQDPIWRRFSHRW